MNIKKTFCLLLAALMLLGMFAGCAAKAPAADTANDAPAAAGAPAEAAGTDAAAPAEAAEEATLEIAVFEGGYGSDYWYAVAKLFEEKHPGVTVNVTANPEIGDIIRPNILSGNPPDFISLPSTNGSGIANALIKENALADLTDTLADIQDQFLPGFLENSKCQPYGDGHTYLVPIYYGASGLWYNKNLFETEGLEAPVTWDDFFALGEKAKEMGRALYTYQGIYPSYNELLITPAIASAVGVDGLKRCADYEPGAWEAPEIREVLNNFARIASEGYLMEGTVALDHTQAQSQWLLGKALLHPNGSWVESEMQDAPREEGFEFGFCAPPLLHADDDKYVLSTIDEIYIPAAAKNLELAKEFLKFQFSDEAIQLNAQLAQSVPPIKGASEYLKGIVSDAIYESYQVFEQGYMPLVDGAFGLVSDSEIEPADEFYNQMSAIMLGEETVDEWIARTEEVSALCRDKLVQ